ncbi:hypothetical protein MCP1_870004 [Candidatus Terasakiella magnetica]|nr:hypothetical protein MCP1_870004 [Candidatus Terasakiella magnetica]
MARLGQDFDFTVRKGAGTVFELGATCVKCVNSVGGVAENATDPLEFSIRDWAEMSLVTDLREN